MFSNSNAAARLASLRRRFALLKSKNEKKTSPKIVAQSKNETSSHGFNQLLEILFIRTFFETTVVMFSTEKRKDFKK